MFGHPGIGPDISVELISPFFDLADRARESIDWFGHKVKVAADSSFKWLLSDMQKHCPEQFKGLQEAAITAYDGLSILNSMGSGNDSQMSIDSRADVSSVESSPGQENSNGSVSDKLDSGLDVSSVESRLSEKSQNDPVGDETDSGVDVYSIKSSFSQESLNDLDDEDNGSEISVSSVKISMSHKGSDSLKSGQTPVLSESNLPPVCSPPIKGKQSSWDKFLARQNEVKQKQILHKANYITRSEAEKQWENGFRKTPSSTVKQGPLTKKQNERTEQFQSRQNTLKQKQNRHNANYIIRYEAERQWEKGLHENTPSTLKQGKLTKKQSEFVKQLSEKTGQKPINEFQSNYDHYNRWKNSLGGDRAKSK